MFSVVDFLICSKSYEFNDFLSLFFGYLCGFFSNLCFFGVLLCLLSFGVRCRFFYASSACIYPEYKQLETDIASLKESDAWPALVRDWDWYERGLMWLFVE